MRRSAIVIAIALLAVLPAGGARAADRTVEIAGGGFGHGIGMSQYGAYGRASNGKSSKQILEHYYKGASVTSASLPGKVRVGLLPAYGSSASSIGFGSTGGGDGKLVVKVKGTKRKIAAGTTSDSWRAEASPTGGFKVFKNGNLVKRSGVSIFGDDDHPLLLRYSRYGSLLSLGGKSYKYAYGKVELGTYVSSSCGGRCARAVLAVSPQKYLYGLGEVPSSWPHAALEAQAIAGRTYLLSKVQRSGQHRSPCDCAVYDSTIDQAYIGDAKRSGSGDYWNDWKGAVDATDDQVIISDGDPIQALYSSSSGGHTENNENVWGGVPIPYLRGVKDRADRAGGANPNFTWKVDMSWSEFESDLNSAYGIGSLEDVKLVKPFGVSGRVTVVEDDGTGGVKIVGSTKTVRVSGWSLRGTLHLKDTLFRIDLGYQVSRKFKAAYNKLDGAPGSAQSKNYAVPRGWKHSKGRAQDFSKGRMVFNRKAGKVTWQWGPVLERYEALGREGGKLGMPTSSLWGPGSFRGATYGRGRILWSKATGAHALKGPFERAFLRTGGATGSLGLPKSEKQKPDALPHGGVRQRFTGGTLYRKKGGPVFALWGPLASHYKQMGEASSKCGYPTSDTETTAADALKATFENGVMKWVDGVGIDVDCDR